MFFNICFTIFVLLSNSILSKALNLTNSCGRSHAKTANSDWKIVGGTKTIPGEFPWQALVIRTFYDEETDQKMMQMCGGTIINEKWVLTAAHCVTSKNIPSYEIYLGTHDLTRKEGTEIIVRVEKIVSHERYIARNTLYDIALMRIKGTIDFANRHKFLEPICLASNNTHLTNQCYAVGFGDQTSKGPTSKVMLKVYEPLFDINVCKAKFRTLETIDVSSQICAGGGGGVGTSRGHGTCSGDSGGPLKCRGTDGKWYQVGITSWGVPCANPGIPDVFTRVSAYNNWIISTINKNS